MFDLKKLLDDTGKNVGRFFSPQQKKPQPVQRQGFVPGQPQQSFQNLHSQQPQQPTTQAPFMLNRSNYQTPKAEPAQIPPPSVNKPQKNTLGYLPTGIKNIANGIGGTIKDKLKDTLLDPGSKTSIVQKAINTTPAVGLGQLPTAQGIARGFDQVTRSIGEAGANSLAGLSGLPQTADLSDKKNPTILGIPHTEGVASILYGQDPVKSIQRETDDLQQSARRSANPTIRAVAPYAPFAAPVIAGVDAGGLVGLGGGAGAIAKEAPQALRTTTKLVNQTANDSRALPQSIREGGYAKIPSNIPVEPHTSPVNPLENLSDGELAQRNYIHNLQFQQGEGAQLPSKTALTPEVKSQISSDLSASVKPNILEPLKQKALKYKSADEFVNSHSPVYHGTNADLTDISQLQSGRQRGEYSNGTRSIFASENPELASKYGKNVLEGRNTGKVLDTTKLGDPHDPNKMVIPKEFSDYATNPILDSTDRRVLENSYFKGGTPSNIVIDHKPNIQEYFRGKGYSAIQIPRGSDVSGPATEMSIIDHNAIKTRQQLTDLYNQTHTQPKITPTTKLVPSVQDKVLASKPAQYLFGDKQPVIDAKANAENITIPGQPEPKLVNNRFTQRIQNSPEVSPEVQAQVSGEHVVRNTKGLVGSVQQQIRSEGLHPSTSRTLAELAQPDASDETLARAIELAKQHDASGTKAGQDVAASLYDQVSEHGVRKGQGIQILSQIAKGSPAGLRNKAFRDLKKAGVEVTPEMKAEIQGHIDTIKSLPDGHAKDFAIAVMQKAVQKHMPQGLTDNLVSLWKAGLLSGVKTQEGNAISNSLFGGLKKVADIPATATDKAISLLTKQRTKASTLRGSAQGAKEGAKSGLTTMKTGIDFRNMGDKYEQHAEINLKNKALQNLFGKPANFVFRGMSAADQPFYYSALKNSLYDQAKAEGITKGLRGKSLKDYMNQTVKNPGEAMVDRADQEAAKSVLGYDTFASKAVTGIHKGIDGIKGVSEQGKAIAHGVVNVLAPFTRVPSAFLSRTIDFTPFGVGKEIFSQVWKKKFDQRALSQAIGEGLTGTGAIAIGMGLANSGQLSGDYPKNDPKEQARWKAEGITANSVKLGNRWYSLNYMGPLGLLFGAGNNLVKAQKGDANAADQAGAVLGGLGSGLLNQSFVQGLSGFSNAIQDPQRNLQSFVNSQAGSVIPSIVNDIGNATDNMQRQANSPIDAMKARIPFVRQGLNPKQDSFGNDLRQAPGNGVEVAFNGTKPSKDTNTPVTREVNRLKDTGKENFVIPTTDKTINVGGETVKLNGNQQYAWNKLVGNKIQDTWGQLIKSPDYQALSDDDKANALRKSMIDITATSKVDFLNKIGRSQLANTASDKLTNAQAEGIDLGNYTSPKSATGSTRTVNNKTAYNDALRKYQKNSGKLSDIQKIKAQDNLASLKIKSGFDKSVTDLYGMSKSDAYAYLSADPDGKAKAQKLIDYGDAQVQAGTTKTNKFKTKDGSVSIQPKDYNPSSAPVERWRAAVSKYFPKEEVNKALWVVAHESGGNETASGDGGKAVGLFQDQHIAPGTSPEDQIKDAARLYTENKKNGGSGWADWGENNLYQGKKFGALGNNPYPGDKKAIEILATMRGGSSGASGTSAVASSSTSKSSGKKKGVKAYNLFANIKSTGGTEQSLRNILKKYGGSANVKTARKIKH